MQLAPTTTLEVRHRKLRDALRASGLDAFVVTHLPNVFYLTNFLATAGIAVVTADRFYLIVDFRYRTAVDEIQSSPHASPATDIMPVERSYDESLVAVLRTLGRARIGVEGATLTLSRYQRLGGEVSEGTFIPTEDMVERLRLIKDDHEIEMLRRGGFLLSAVAVDVMRAVTAGMKELELAAKIDWSIKSIGFERCSFETIVASGPHSAQPHSHPGSRALREGDLVVLDFGGVYGGYCVDLTRTVAIGTPDPEMRRVYDAVLEAQRAAIAVVKPGIRAGDIDAAAREVLARHDLAGAFGHSTGHGLGIEIHEAPRVGPRREGSAGAPAPPDELIESGMIFTIEPGAYIPGWGGVRIEDDVLVTADGVQELTNVPRELRGY